MTSKELTIKPGSVAAVVVFFEPAYKEDFVSRSIAENLVIDFIDHPSTAEFEKIVIS